jgi:molecular chaperone Hsp33
MKLKNYLNKHFSKRIFKRSFSDKSNTQETLKDYPGRRDHLISGFFSDGSARFVISDISQTLSHVANTFKLTDKAKLKQLGICFNTSLIINSFLEGEERVKLISQYSSGQGGGLTTMYSESICTGEIRGFIEESKQSADANFKPYLKISKILYNRHEEMYGLVKLIEPNGLTEDDIYNYFETSEQIRTHVFLKNRITEGDILSLGFILQKMPDCDTQLLENRFIRIVQNKNFRDIIAGGGLNVTTFNRALQDLDIRVEGLRRTPIQFYCRCSKGQFIDVLKTLGKETITDMKSKGQNKVTCRNCNKVYELTDNDFNYLNN